MPVIHKAGASITPAPQAKTKRRGSRTALVPCALKVGSHSFSFQAQFIPILMGRTTGRASGIIFPLSGPVRANVPTDHHRGADK